MPRRRATPVEPAPETGYRDPELAYDYPTHQNVPNFDCRSWGEYHDKCGKFKKGNPGGPGRPRKKKPELQHIENDYITRVANRVSPERFDTIVDKALEQADAGDRFARNWLSQILLFNNGRLIEIAAADQAGLDSEDLIAQKRRERHPGTDKTEPMPQDLMPVATPKCLQPLFDRVAEEVKPNVLEPGYVPKILPPFPEYPELNATFPAYRTPPYTGENVPQPSPCESLYGFAIDPHAPEELVPELTRLAEELSATEFLPHEPAPAGLIKITPASAPSDLPERLTSRMMLPSHSPRALPPPPPGVVFPYETCHVGPVCFGPDRPMLEIPGYGRVDARWIEMTRLEREGRMPERITIWWGILYDEQGFWPIPFGQEGRLRKERLKGTDFGDLAMREIGRGPHGEQLTPGQLALQRAENMARQGYGPNGQKLAQRTVAEDLNPLRPGGAHELKSDEGG